jgi:succinoglycan biosynthesis transport protein ExoP
MRGDLRRVPPGGSLGGRRLDRSLLEAPLRHRWLVAACLVTCTAVALGATLVVQKKYRSSLLILVEQEKMPDSFVAQVATESTRQRLMTLKQEVLSRTRLERVIKELDPYPQAMAAEPLSQVVERMRRAIVVLVKGTDAFSIEYVHSDPEKAMQVANRLASLFIEEVTHSRQAQVEGASQFIETQLQEARRNLEAHEEAVRRYKQQHVGRLPEQLPTNLSTLERLQLAHQGMSESLRAAQDRLTLLQTAPRTPAGTLAPYDREGELQALREQREALRDRYTAEHPDMVALQARIARLEKAGSGPADPDPVPGRPASPVTAAQLEVVALKARRDDLERRMAEVQQQVEQAPRIEQGLATLTRDYNKLNENYLALLNKKLEAQMAEKLEKRWKGEQFKILDPAPLPERPVYPERAQFLLVGAVVGLLLGVGSAVGVELLDHSVKSAAELRSVLPYPLLATVGHIAPAAAQGRYGR